ncbi:MAG: Cro/CI family transcriptional regulator [Rhodospirillales bacterium]
MLSVLESAAHRVGGIGNLADGLGITRQALYQWTRVPAERVIDIERLTGVSRHELRPDLYPAEQKFDHRELRNALGKFATGITVITTRNNKGRPEGLTANSFTALSLEPPMVLWCLAKRSPSFPAFESCSHFAVNVLNKDQRTLSHQFATPADDKFSGVTWNEGLGGVPVLPDSLAHFECRNTLRYEGGDHLIFIGEVERFTFKDGEPLLYNSGKYGIAAPHPDDHGMSIVSSDFEDLLL